MDELLVTLSSLVSHTGQMGIPLLAVLAHHAAVIEGVLSEEALRVVVAVDVDLSQCIMGSRFLTALVDTSLQPRQKQLQSVKEIKIVNNADQNQTNFSQIRPQQYKTLFLANVNMIIDI